ncbi:hypothetical protein [Marisediminicola sp. LYQ85]|uniref:hypothetical protein n=1 Tax=Marisediminicola sp. LYQ85 TaxID=3391062 RepID=UPI003982F361
MGDPATENVDGAVGAFALGVRALELASQRVRVACEGDDIDTAAIEVHFGLHAVYDLHEALFTSRGIESTAGQDEVYGASRGEAAGALVFARGGRTHELVTFATRGGFGDLPYGMGPYGGGWLWADYSSTQRAFRQRSEWYRDRVRYRYLWDPLDEAWAWFRQHAPSSSD